LTRFLINSTFPKIHADLGPVDVLVYNAGSGVWGTIETVNAEAFEQSWRINTLGLFLCSRAVIPGMKSQGRGAIVITGATASRRGAPSPQCLHPPKPRSAASPNPWPNTSGLSASTYP
jgi:NAD(P)-dependent dehydrogenase (short-subunit alcohol dehydrogenase family)